MKNVTCIFGFFLLLIASCSPSGGGSPSPTTGLNYTSETIFVTCITPYGTIADVYDTDGDNVDDIILFEGSNSLDLSTPCTSDPSVGGYYGEQTIRNHIIISGSSSSTDWNSKSCNSYLSDLEYTSGISDCSDYMWLAQQKELAVGDFDGDMTTDYVYSQKEEDFTFGSGPVQYLVNEPYLEYSLVSYYSSSNISAFEDFEMTRSEDINGDGYDDLIYGRRLTAGNIKVRFGSSSGLGTDVVLIPNISTPSRNIRPISFDFLDFDGDGDLDAITVFDDQQLGFVENQGNATNPDFLGVGTQPIIHDFSAVFPSVTTSSFSSVGIMDYDLDGDETDIVLTTTSNDFVVLIDQ